MALVIGREGWYQILSTPPDVLGWSAFPKFAFAVFIPIGAGIVVSTLMGFVILMCIFALLKLVRLFVSR